MRLLPQSLFGRLLLFLTGGLVLAQLLSAGIRCKTANRRSPTPSAATSPSASPPSSACWTRWTRPNVAAW